jgi:glycosyltransferase involved in cell wall biosynthesis
MNILFTRFPLESALGGAEIQTISLMRGLQERGHHVEFLGSCPVMLELCERNDIASTECSVGPPPVTKWGAISFLWRQRAMKRKLSAQFSILNSQFPIDAIVMMSLSEKLLLTPLLTNHSYKIQDTRYKILWLEHDRVGNWLTKNPWLLKLRKLSANVMTVCVSKLSAKIYEDLGWEQERKHKDTAIGCIARLTQDKGVDILIRVIEHIPNARLTIIGSGNEEDNLRELISDLGLDDRVSIEERSDDLGVFYQSIDLLVLPSREHDPYGLVAAEAMALGTPVLVTDACGIAGELEDGTDATVVYANSIAALQGGLIRALEPEKLTRIGLRGKQTARARFSVETMVDAYEKLLEQSKQSTT